MGTEILSGNNNIQSSPASTQMQVVLKQFLRFQLFPDTIALLPVTEMIEVLTIPVGQIVPIPNMSPWVMGVYNWRGEILWNLDLGNLIGLTPLHQQPMTRSHYTAIVLVGSQQQSNNKGQNNSQFTGRKVLGLVVDKVEDMEWCSPEVIESPPQSAITPELAPFLRGYWMKPGGEMLLVLAGEAIMAGINNT